MSVVIWHNPRCSKSRQTLSLLEEQGVEPKILLYLDNPPSQDEIAAALKKLKIEAKALIRKKEAKEEGVDLDGGDAALVKAMAAHPRIIERPVVIKGSKAALGRPPENVLDIL